MGIQCVDCVRESSRGQRAARTPLGAKIRGGRPVVTITIIAMCVVSWLLQLATGGFTGPWVQALAFSPAAGEHEPYRMLTTAFLHSQNPLHILFNMYALWIMGPFLEAMLGRARYVALYVLCAVGGSVGVLLLATPGTASWYTAAIGASGAIFGLFGAIAVVLRRTGQNATSMITLIVVNFALGFVIQGIAWQAHLGGLVVGVILGLVFAYVPADRRAVLSWAACAVVALALVLLSVHAYAGAAAGTGLRL